MIDNIFIDPIQLTHWNEVEIFDLPNIIPDIMVVF